MLTFFAGSVAGAALFYFTLRPANRPAWPGYWYRRLRAVLGKALPHGENNPASFETFDGYEDDEDTYDEATRVTLGKGGLGGQGPWALIITPDQDILRITGSDVPGVYRTRAFARSFRGQRRYLVRHGSDSLVVRWGGGEEKRAFPQNSWKEGHHWLVASIRLYGEGSPPPMRRFRKFVRRYAPEVARRWDAARKEEPTRKRSEK